MEARPLDHHLLGEMAQYQIKVALRVLPIPFLMELGMELPQMVVYRTVPLLSGDKIQLTLKELLKRDHFRLESKVQDISQFHPKVVLQPDLTPHHIH